jgi:hypothetical protein
VRFDLKNMNGLEAVLKYGDPGRELSCFMPEDSQWEQINYGQGEGQLLVNGCEWGFYYTDDNSLSVVLHKGPLSRSEAEAFVDAVKLKIYGADSVNVEVKFVE